MKDANNPSEEAIFSEALRLQTPQERAAYLNGVVHGDERLRHRIEALLQAHEQAGVFMDESPAAFASSTLAIATGMVPLTEKPGDKIGRYKLREQIGEGGCGVVYVAEQEEPLRRRVALKVIKLGMDTKQVVARFEAERQALALMDHPNIAKVLDAGATETGRPYFVMELVRGIKITDYCDKNNLSTEERLKLFIQVCSAIQHAHQKGIIHRDIKPSNILVTLHDGVPVPKVIDFGIAKATSDQRLTDKTIYTAFEQFIGTPAYMSPEQAEMSGLDIDTRSDIYSLGVLLYELLTGRTPFDAETLLKAGLDQMRQIIREQEPQRPSTRLSTLEDADLTVVAGHRRAEPPKLVSLVRGDLDWIVMKSLEKDRTRRYETAIGFALDVQRHLNNEAVVARPPSNLYRFHKFVRRNKLGFAAVAAIVTVLVAGAAAAAWQALRAQAAARHADMSAANEKRQSALAQAEANRSQRLTTLLKQMLNGVGPALAPGGDTRMLQESFDKTVERVGEDWKDQPDIEAQLRNAIGQLYFARGEFAKAEAMHQTALATLRKMPGSPPGDRLDSLHNLANVLLHENKLSEAEPLQQEAVEIRRRILGSEHPDVASALDALGWTLVTEGGKLAEAERVQREALTIRRKSLGNQSQEVAWSLRSLIWVLRGQGKWVQAETLQLELLEVGRKMEWRNCPDEIESLGFLSEIFRSQNKFAEAERICNEALAISRKKSGDESTEVAASLSYLGTVLARQGKLGEAETRQRQALEMRRKLLGNEHPEVVWTLIALTDVLGDEGKVAEAQTVRSEALALAKKAVVSSKGQQGSLGFLCSLGEQARRQGQLAEAEVMFREQLNGARSAVPLNAGFVGDALANLTGVFHGQGKTSEAEAVQREVLELTEKMLRDNVPGAFTFLNNLGFSARNQGRLTDAAAIYRVRLQGARSVTNTAVVRDTLASLARTLLYDGQFTQAEPLARELISLCGETYPGHWDLFWGRSLLGGSLLGQKKYVEAEPLLLSGYEGLKQREGSISSNSGPGRLKEALQRLVELYEATGRSEQAAGWKRPLEELLKQHPEIQAPAKTKK